MKEGKRCGNLRNYNGYALTTIHCCRGPGAMIVMKNLPLSNVYQLLEPGPVVLLTTAHKGRTNVMAMFWHMMVEFEPPLVACVVSNADYSFAALRATKECVIASPALEFAPKIVEVGNCSGRDTAKFEKQPHSPHTDWRARLPQKDRGGLGRFKY